MTFNSIQGVQFSAFRAPGSGFDPALLNVLWETSGIITIGEFIATTSLFAVTANFTGPIDVVSGENDLPTCDGNCYLPYNLPPALKGERIPTAANFLVGTSPPKTGNFLNYHYSAAGTYGQIQSFIKWDGFWEENPLVMAAADAKRGVMIEEIPGSNGLQNGWFRVRRGSCYGMTKLFPLCPPE